MGGEGAGRSPRRHQRSRLEMPRDMAEFLVTVETQSRMGGTVKGEWASMVTH
jgi:hypothetical protein